MSNQVQRRRNTTAGHSTFTGAVGEITVDTDKKVAVVHDGVTPGGFPQEAPTNKDASGGYVGLTLFKINFKNALDTFTSFFVNANTAARTYTFPDKNMTVGDASGDSTIVRVGALDAGSITPGFGSIDIGADSMNAGPGTFDTLTVTSSSNLAVATATSLNKVTVTQPATSATLTLADGVTLSVSANATLSGTNTGDNATNSQYSGLAAAKENLYNKATTFATLNDSLYPSVQAVATYIDGLLVGLWDDRGSYDASVNTYPAAGGSGTAGAVLKGDIWTVSVAGTLGGVAVAVGDSVRAVVDTPAQTAANWAVVENNIGYVPENVANKDASGGYPGLTLFKLNLRNAANTVTSWFTTAATAARTWTMPDKDGTVAMLDDITGTNSGTNTGDETGVRVAALMHAATAKTTPVDADEVVLADSEDSWSLKSVTLTNIKAFLKTYFDTLYRTQCIPVSCSDESTALTTGTAKVTFRMPYAFTLTAVRASVTTAPTGSVLTVDINESGTTILSTKLTIDDAEKTSTTAATPAVISDTALADDAEMTIDIDGVGSTIAGAGLKVYLIGYRT